MHATGYALPEEIKIITKSKGINKKFMITTEVSSTREVTPQPRYQYSP